MKKIFLVAFLMIWAAVPAVVRAETSDDRPHWSLEFKGGTFDPAIDNWATYYGKDYTGELAGAVAYKITRQIEAGIEGGYIKDKGVAFAPLHQAFIGNVVYELYPVNVFVLVRGVFSEEQWLVPYVGGGFTRMYYREEVQGQNVVRGSADGSHIRGGLQLLLDGIDPAASTNLYHDYGIYHTYLFFEIERTQATVDSASGSVDLGGTSWLGGLLFEF